MNTRRIVKGLGIVGGAVIWAGLGMVALSGLGPSWLGLLALGAIPVVACYLWISDDIRSRRTDAYRPIRPQSMSEHDGTSPSREEYMRNKPVVQEPFEMRGP